MSSERLLPLSPLAPRAMEAFSHANPPGLPETGPASLQKLLDESPLGPGMRSALYEVTTRDVLQTGLPVTDAVFTQYRYPDACRVLRDITTTIEDSAQGAIYTESLRQYLKYHRQMIRYDRDILNLWNTFVGRNIYVPLQILYGEESPPFMDERQLVDIALASPEDMNFVFGDMPPARDELSLEDVASCLRASVDADLSKATLDARFELCEGLVGVTLAYAIAGSLRDYAVYSPTKNQRAARFITDHREELMGDDVASKRVLLLKVAEMMSQAAKQESHEYDRITLGQRRQVLSAAHGNVAQLHDFFTTIYQRLGYELPEKLRPAPEQPQPVAPVVRIVRPAVPHVPQAQAPQPPSAEDLARNAAYDGRYADLQERIGTHAAAWIASRTAIRRAGLTDAVHTLKTGAHGELTTVYNEAIPAPPPLHHDYVVALVGVLLRVQEHVADGGKARAMEAIADAQADRQALATELQNLHSAAQADGYEGRPVTTPTDVDTRLQFVADYWHVFRQLLHGAGCAVGSIWQVLPVPRADSAYARAQAAIHQA